MEGTDICYAPVLSLEEAPKHPHNLHRKAFAEIDGVVQPAPAPRFSRTQSEIQGPPPFIGQHSEEALADWGIAADEIAALKKSEAI